MTPTRIIRELAFPWPFYLAAWLCCASGALGQGQACYGGLCYPAQQQQPSARLVYPVQPPSPSIPHVGHCRIHNGDFVGSGTLISKNDSTGTVLTCSHLFDDGVKRIIVTFGNGDRFAARLLDRDRANDLAALLIRFPFQQPVPVSSGDPSGVLIACGFGGDGKFRPVQGSVTGAAQPIGASTPSIKIGAAVRPGDSGGAGMNTSGQLVGVVWGCRDGETYLTCGQSLRLFLDRVLPDRRGRIISRAAPLGGATPGPAPPYQPPIAEQAPPPFVEPIRPQQPEIEVEITEPLEPVQPAIPPVVETTPVQPPRDTTIVDTVIDAVPSTRTALTYGPIVAGALGLSTPIGMGIVLAAMIGRRRLKRRIAEKRIAEMAAAPTQRQPPDGQFVPIQRPPPVVTTESPAPPQVVVPTTHFAPYETDSFARADSEAMTQYVRKYPGAATTLESFKGMRQQYQQAMR